MDIHLGYRIKNAKTKRAMKRKDYQKPLAEIVALDFDEVMCLRDSRYLVWISI